MRKAFAIVVGTAATMAMLGGLLLCSPAWAQVSYRVEMLTSALSGHPSGPFSLDFQLTNGDGAANNTVALSNFVFSGGGNAVGTPLTLLGGASGDLSSGVTLTEASFLNEFEQGFDPGATLAFDVAISTNFAGGTPDALTFAILDNAVAELPTLSFLDTFFVITFSGSSPTIETFASDPDVAPEGGGSPLSIPAPTLTLLETSSVAPEQDTGRLFFTGLLLVLGGAFIQRRRSISKA